MPQPPPVLQDEAALELNENEPPPLTLDANVESFFLTCGLPQLGQVTSAMALELRSSSSKGWLQSVQMNSNSGIGDSWRSKWFQEDWMQAERKGYMHLDRERSRISQRMRKSPGQRLGDYRSICQENADKHRFSRRSTPA
jgi:hypothetical protein